MKLSELQGLLKYYQNLFKDEDPDILIRQEDKEDGWEEKDIVDSCRTISSERDDAYICLLTFDEDEYYNRPNPKPEVYKHFKELMYSIDWAISDWLYNIQSFFKKR